MTIPFTDLDRIFIDSEWQAPEGGCAPVINPATEEVFAEAPVADTTQVNAAIAAARDAFDNGPWPRMSMDERADVMAAMAQALRQHQGELNALIVAEVGCAQGVTHMM